MKTKTSSIRNPFAPLAKKRKGGKHQVKKEKKPKSQEILKEIDNDKV